MKKKVEIITILDVANFGTMLQAYALGKRIKDLGMNVEFLDYTRPAHAPSDKFKTFCHDKSLGNVVKRVGFGFAALMSYSFIRRKSRKFVTSHFPLSKNYTKIEDIKKNPPRADLYMTGSDQVWNSSYNEGIDRVFFLDFIKGRKIAYAASVGISEFPSEEIPEIKSLLGQYEHIAVRESQTAEYLTKLGLPNIQHVLDPTLLLNMDEWKKVIHYKERRHEPFLLVYSVERFNNDFIFEQARKIAKARNLKMYAISATYPVKAKEYGFDKIFALASVPQFLSLMIEADFVVASSFHGTAFSVNFNKDFITISAKNFNIRMESFIKQFDILHRIVTTEFVENNQLQPIDYVTINAEMEKARETSHHYLKEILSD